MNQVTKCSLPYSSAFFVVGLLIAFGAGLTVISGQEAEKRLPIPDEAAQTKAQKIVVELYKAEYEKKSVQDKRLLAEEFLKRAVETEDEPTCQYVLFCNARDLAVDGGDVVISLDAIGKMGDRFEIDLLAQKAAVLAKLQSKVEGRDATKMLAEQCESVLNEAVDMDRYDVAKQLVAIGEDLGRKIKDIALVSRMAAKRDQLQEVMRDAETAKSAEKTLQTKPDDAEANSALGKFLCLKKGNWEKGLPLLSKGADQMLQELAQKDLVGPEGILEQVTLGDGWWSLGEKEKNRTSKNHLLARARHWYEQAFPQLKGLTKTRVQKKLETLDRTVSSKQKSASGEVGTALDESFGKLRLGASQQDVIDSFGPPDRRRTFPGSAAIALDYDKLGLQIFADDKKGGVYAFNMTSPKLALKSGIRVGDSIEKVVRLLGPYANKGEDPFKSKASSGTARVPNAEFAYQQISYDTGYSFTSDGSGKIRYIRLDIGNLRPSH